MAITKEEIMRVTGGNLDPANIKRMMSLYGWTPNDLAGALKGTSLSQINSYLGNSTPTAAPQSNTPSPGANPSGGQPNDYNKPGVTRGFSFTPKLDANGQPDANTQNYIKQIKDQAANNPYPGMTAEQSVTKAVADYANQYNLDATQLASGFDNISPGTVSNYANMEGRTLPGVGVGGSDAAGGGNGSLFPTQQDPDLTDYPLPPGDINYFGAAENQGTANYNAAVDTSRLSNPNIVNPYGGQKVGYDENGRPIVEQYLSNTEQNKLDQYKGMQGTLFGNMNNATSTPFSTGDARSITADGTPGGVRDVADAMWEREQPRMEQRRNQTETDLLVRGFNPGTEGYDDRMDEVSRAENDFRLGNMAQAGAEESRLFNLQSGARNQDISDMLTDRQQPFQEYDSAYSSLSPTMPNYQQFTGTNVDAAPVYNSAVDQGLFGLQRYSTGVQGELGTRSIDANKKATTRGMVGDVIGAGIGAYGA